MFILFVNTILHFVTNESGNRLHKAIFNTEFQRESEERCKVGKLTLNPLRYAALFPLRYFALIFYSIVTASVSPSFAARGLLFRVCNSSSNLRVQNRHFYLYKRFAEQYSLPPNLQSTKFHQKQLFNVFTLVDFGVFVYGWHFLIFRLSRFDSNLSYIQQVCLF